MSIRHVLGLRKEMEAAAEKERVRLFRILLVGIALIGLVVLLAGCYCTSEKETATIPHRHNVDSFTIVDGHLADIKTHKRVQFEEPNCPMTLPLYEIREDGNFK